MKPHALEFKSPLELSAQGECTTHTHTCGKQTTKMHFKKINSVCLSGYGGLSNKRLGGRSHTQYGDFNVPREL